MAIPYADILILALVAGFILLRLRSVLGKNSDSTDRPNMSDTPPKSPKDASNNASESGVLSFPQMQNSMKNKLSEPIVASDQAAIDALGISTKLGVEAIKAADAQFNLNSFKDGAKAAFEMVLKAFSENDKATLSMLLAPELAKVFIQEAEARANSENKAETTLVSIVSAEVKAAELNKKIARITLDILSEQVSIVRNKEGEIIEGNPSHAERVEDEWVFERDTMSKNPNWTIVDT